MLPEILRSLDLVDKTPAEAQAALSASVNLSHDHTLWTYNGVANQFGPAAAEGLAQAMAAAGLTTAVMVYAARGFDLSLEATQQQLDAIAAGVPQLAQVCGALKLIGRPVAPQWQVSGLGTLPTEEEIATAQSRLLAEEMVRLAINLLQQELDKEVIDFAGVVSQINGI